MRSIAYKSVLIFCASIVLILSVIPSLSSKAAEPPTSYDQMEGLSLIEGSEWGNYPISYIKAWVDRSFEIPCKGIDDPGCADQQISIGAYLLPCSTTSTLACIEEVYSLDGSGKKTGGEFLRTVARNEATDFTENLERGLIAGEGMGSLWKFPGITHGGGSDEFAVRVNLAGWSRESDTDRLFNSAQMSISAVKPVYGNYSAPSFELNSAARLNGFRNVEDECVMNEAGVCYKRVLMPSDQRFGMKVRLPNAMSGWFHGRIYRPDFKISRAGKSWIYEIEAAPVSVPEIKKRLLSSQWSQDFTDYVKSQWPMSNGGGLLLPGNSGNLALELTKRFLPMIDDRATASGDHWIFRTLNGWRNGNVTEVISPKIVECSEDTSKISGVVTTNSMVYSFGPPTYNASSGTLDYTVLSPHLDENGKENLGSYDLLINSEVARCIYGFSSAPVKADIQIVGTDGTSKVATTILGERNGWLFLSANGYTYSAPTIRVTLSQEVPPKIEPSPSPSPIHGAQSVSKEVTRLSKVTKRSIKATCVKGKLTKKLTGTKVKCPKGWRTE